MAAAPSQLVGVSVDIVRAWKAPRKVMAERLRESVSEPRAMIFLITACLLIFLAQVPRLWREAQLDPTMPFDMRMGGALLGWIFVAPLALYLIATISRVLARLFGGRGSWYDARLALFWSLLAVSPLWLINGLIAGLFGSGYVLRVSGLIALAMFVFIWAASLFEAEKGDKRQWT